MPGRQRNRRRLPSRAGFLGALVAVIVALLLAVPGLGSTGTPTISSDLPDYNPGQTVTLTGTGWTPGEAVHIHVAENNTTVTWSYDSDPDPVAGVDGNLTYKFQLPNTFIANYIVTATGQVSGATATTTFTDGNPSASLDQCQNGAAPSPSSDGCDTDATDWARGNLVASKSNYFEGDSIPYRLSFDNLSLSPHAVTISWDTTKSSKHALDYLTTYNASVTTADPCVGLTCGSMSTFAIPKDPQVDTAHLPITQADGDFTLWGGTITGVSGYTHSPAGFTGDTTASITIDFTANVADPVLAWGGHIASRHDWGQDAAAVAIPGSPYHTSLVDLDGQGGSQDTQLSAQAVTFPGSITIVKAATPEGSTSFPFTASPSPLSNFSLVDDGTSSNTHVFSNITTFQDYTVAESVPGGWSLDSVGCSATSPNGGTYTVTNPSVKVTMKEGEDWTCTFNDSRDTAKLELRKATVPSTDTGTFNLYAKQGTVTKLSALGVGNDGTSGTGGTTVDAGSYDLSEEGAGTTALSDYDQALACKNRGDNSSVTVTSGSVTLAKGADVICTFTNTRHATLTIKKLTTPASSGADSFGFTSSSSGVDASFTLDTNSADATYPSQKAFTISGSQFGSKSVTEGATTGWTLTGVDCGSATNSGSGATATVDIEPGDDVTCTFTNKKDGSLTIVKDAKPNDLQDFSFSAANLAVSSFTLDDDQGVIGADTTYSNQKTFTNIQNFNTKTVTENPTTGWDLTKITCTGDTDSDVVIGRFDDQNNFVNGGSDGFDAGDTTVQVGLDEGENVTCTFENSRLPTLTVKKHVIGGTATAGDWQIYVKTGDPPANVTGSPQAGSETGTTYTLSPGTYAASEGAGPSGYAFKGFSGDCDATAGTITLAYGENKTCTLTNESTAAGVVTDSALCTFDEDTGTAGRQFRLLYTQSAQTPPYKLNGSNPGQFYYNVFYNGAAGAQITLTLPYPFITQGAMSVHFYASVATRTVNGQTCYVPGREIGSDPTAVTLANYPAAYTYGSTNKFTVTVPQNVLAEGFAYVNIHLDYGLKGTGSYSKDTNNNAVDQSTPPKILIPDQQTYTFSNSVAPVGPGDTVMSLNVFKKNPGIGGLVKKNDTAQPLPNVKAQIYQGTSLKGTVYTDDDGWYMWAYKYTGKATTFTVKLPNYGLSKSDTLKSNGFLSMDFTTP
jgi:Prealbumin-like fold domain